MSELKNHGELDEYAVTTIRVKSKKLIGKAGYSKADSDDIRQEITLDLLQRLPNFDPSKSSLHTFVNDVVDHKIARMIEVRNAEMRDFKTVPLSLNVLEEDADGTLFELIDEIADETLPWNRDAGEMSEYELLELRNDIIRVLSKLPPQLREICLRLMRTSIFVVAKEMGIPRATLYDHLKIIRERFEKSGLKNYF